MPQPDFHRDQGVNATHTPQDGADPSMEDILASIRRILNDGDAGAPEPADPDHDELGDLLADTHHGDPPGTPPAGGEDVFLLDSAMMIDETHHDMQPSAPHGADHHEPQEQPPHQADEDFFAPPPLVAPETVNATSSSMGALVRALHERNMPVNRSGGVTLEDIVRDEMRPLVKSWLDEHLPPMVERLVRAEIERVVGRAVG